jgi:tRNA pseudouridine55 synthase
MKPQDFNPSGIFAVNKPVGMTSHDVVAIVRKKTGVKRVGHGGTLDPLAQGVLVIAVGRENTKQLDKFVKGSKEYIAEIFLGANSTTDDEEGIKEIVNVKSPPLLSKIEEMSKLFIGDILQTPPIYSSIKISGKPSHRLVRKGENIKLEPRKVSIQNIEILDYEFPILKLKVTTGPGVYIRALARDIGEKLQTGGYLKSLIRTKVNNFTLENAKKIEEI